MAAAGPLAITIGRGAVSLGQRAWTITKQAWARFKWDTMGCSIGVGISEITVNTEDMETSPIYSKAMVAVIASILTAGAGEYFKMLTNKAFMSKAGWSGAACVQAMFFIGLMD